MIYICFHRNFKRMYRRLASLDKKRVSEALRLFRKNPLDRNLRNHKLKGEMSSRRAIHAGFDLCIVFEVKGDYESVILVLVGKHEDVYK